MWTTTSAIRIITSFIYTRKPILHAYRQFSWHTPYSFTIVQVCQQCLWNSRILVQKTWAYYCVCTGKKSHWSPYIQTLPKDPPCAWMWSSKKLEEYFQNLPVGCTQGIVKSFYKFLPTHQEMLEAEIDDTVDVFGDAFDVDAIELTWCAAQIQSRAFSTSRYDMGAALHPVIDLLNHSDNAAFPLGWVIQFHILQQKAEIACNIWETARSHFRGMHIHFLELSG